MLKGVSQWHTFIENSSRSHNSGKSSHQLPKEKKEKLIIINSGLVIYNI